MLRRARTGSLDTARWATVARALRSSLAPSRDDAVTMTLRVTVARALRSALAPSRDDAVTMTLRVTARARLQLLGVLLGARAPRRGLARVDGRLAQQRVVALCLRGVALGARGDQQLGVRGGERVAARPGRRSQAQSEGGGGRSSSEHDAAKETQPGTERGGRRSVQFRARRRERDAARHRGRAVVIEA